MGSYLTRQTTVPTSEKTFTFSTWMKVSGRTGSDNGIIEWYRDSNNRHQILIDSTTSKLRVRSLEVGSLKVDIHSDAVFRDPSAWYHICIHSDNTQASASNRFKLWVNGVAQTFSTYTWSFNQGVNINVYDGTSGDAVNVGTKSESTSNSFDGCLADTYYIDGYTIAHTEFGQTDSTSGIWKPNTSPTISSYGNAGFHLTYEDSSNLGDDTSGNSKDMTSVGTITQNVDNPSNNFATLNPVSTASNLTYANGNLQVTGASTSVWKTTFSSLGMFYGTTGKYYCEMKVSTLDSQAGIGVWGQPFPKLVTSNFFNNHHQYGIVYKEDGSVSDDSQTFYTGSSFTSGDIIQCALDLTNSKVYFGKNGTWQNSGVPTSGSTGTGAVTLEDNGGDAYFFTASSYGNDVLQMNFGQGKFGTTAVSSAGSNASGVGTFEYDVPTGYQSLSTRGINSF